MTELPTDMPAGLTADWLTKTLHDGGFFTDARITGVTRSQVGDGTGMMSELSRLNLTWSSHSAELPASLIAKYASTNPMNRAAANGFHVYEREVRYFLEVDPHTTTHTPECYFGKLEPDNYLILMQDLSDYRVGSQAAGAGIEDTTLAIDQLARIHAPFWNNVDSLDWVPHIHRSYHADAMVVAARGGWDNMARVFGQHMPEPVRAARDQILAAIPAMQANMDSAPLTLVHGDFRLDNVLFGEKPGQYPAVILDWQGPLLCKGIVDVALLLGQNIHIDVRRQHERALIQRYVEQLKALGVDYDVDSAWKDYLDALLYQWCYCSTVTGSLDSSNPKASAWMAQCVARQCTATLDHGLLSQLPRFL